MAPLLNAHRKQRHNMKNGQHRVTLTLGAVAGGLLAATLLPIGVAFADEYDYTRSHHVRTHPGRGIPAARQRSDGNRLLEFLRRDVRDNP